MDHSDPNDPLTWATASVDDARDWNELTEDEQRQRLKALLAHPDSMTESPLDMDAILARVKLKTREPIGG